MVAPTQYNSPNYIPQRGDVVMINFEPQKGVEIQKRRPAVVLSPFTFNRAQKVAVVCPITRTKRKSEFQVGVPTELDVEGFIRTDQFTTLNWKAGKARYLCYLPDDTVDEVCDIVQEIVWDTEYDPDYVPLRGTVVEIEGKSGKRDYALVLSASSFNYWQRVFVICPIISSSTGSVLSKFAVEIPDQENVNVKGVILADQVKSWDWWAREAKYLCYLPDDTVNQVSDIVEAIVWGD